jgi:hypothetical protein
LVATGNNVQLSTESARCFIRIDPRMDRPFQCEGKPGPWEAFTMSAEDLDGANGDLPPD